ncbi:MAG: hypothetical protein CM15mP23_19110 [Cryomorphaceae bacterium]|nr:MAG: hypothetical protein CM15mP23_19110 [Cryomorphaceae bacterium]
MKNVFTLPLFTLLTVTLSFAQGFEPPLGSTYNADSTEITLPSAYLDANYIDSIIFDVPESFTVELGGQSLDLPFNFAQITGVATPSGMAYDCSVMSCYFEANTSGGVVLSGIPTETGLYELALSAAVSINGAPLGINLDVDFNIPYTGGNVLLDLALNGDYSVLNDVIPTFFINVEPAENNPNLSIDSKNIENFDRFVMSPNPASEIASFSFYNNDAKYISLEIYDLLGNLVYADQLKGCVQTEQTYNVNTSLFNNGVYLYKMSTSNASHSGRLVVNK